MEQITALKALPNYRLWIRYGDGTEGEVDLSGLVGLGVFAAWERPGVFQSVELSEFGAPEWPGGIDLCRDSLYLQLTGKTVGDLSPTPASVGSA